MNEQLQKNLGSLLELLQKAMMQSYDFGKQELPLFIKEYLAWMFYHSCIQTVACLFGTIVLLYFCYKCWNALEGDDKIFGVFLCIPLVIAGFLCLGIIDGIENAVKVKVAPRVVLMEKAKELISNK